MTDDDWLGIREVDDRVIVEVWNGTQPVEFEKGKAAIAVPSRDKLASLIDGLIKAVEAGELDELLPSARRSRRDARRSGTGTSLTRAASRRSPASTLANSDQSPCPIEEVAKLVEQPWRIMSIGVAPMGAPVLINGNWYMSRCHSPSQP